MKNKYTLGLVLTCCMVVLACSKNEPQAPNVGLTPTRMRTNNAEPAAYREGNLILGKKLNNPYTIENMKLAVAALNKKGLYRLAPAQVKASHYYVRFTPTDSVQANALDKQPNLTLYPYPLDYEIAERGNYYLDPSTPKGAFAYQYASVKVNYPFSRQIKYEILSPLYIPEEDQALKGTENVSYVEQLLNQAYKQTGNFQDTVALSKPNVKHPWYAPGGKIQVWDTRLNKLIGLEGLDMRARRWFTTYHARTDFFGNYRMNNTFKHPCNYSLWFNQEDFTVRPHLFDFTAWIDGPKQYEDWNVDIMGGYDRFVSHIFRGAYRYHYGFIDGLKRPYLPIARLKYIAKDSGGPSGNTLVPFPIIYIHRYDKSNIEHSSDEIFSSTCHETAHSSHQHRMDFLAISYATVSTWLQESWAVGVEWWLTKLEYKNTRGIANYGDYDYVISVEFPNKQGYQKWTLADDNEYTNIYINLIDDYNEKGILSTTDDDVKGYTLANIEDSMLHQIFTLKSLEKKLKEHKPSGVTDEDIDKLLNYY
ncbi:MAG: hypothetical protein NT021_01030 [Sphingobacteriales bacterium]|nr:hypothetical protein [Sphingobacteriales bacterium]